MVLPIGVLGDVGAFCPRSHPCGSAAMGSLLTPSRDFCSKLRGAVPRMLWQRGAGSWGWQLVDGGVLQQHRGCDPLLSHGWAAGRSKPWSFAGPSLSSS